MLDESPARRFPSLVSAAALSRELLAVTDEAGRLVELDGPWAAVLGHDPASLLLRPFLDLVHTDDQQAFDDVSTGATTVSIRMPSFRGDMRWLEWTVMRGPTGALFGTGRDVTGERDALAAVAVVERRFRQTLEQAPIGMGLVALDGRWLQVNHALCAIAGRSEEELRAGDVQAMVPQHDLAQMAGLARRALAGRLARFDVVLRLVRGDGSVAPVHAYVSLVRDEREKPLYFVTQVVDISAQLIHEEELARLALHDGLTALLNHRAFHARLEEEVERARRYGAPLCLALVDLDHFKSINDTHGHQTGDRILAGMARLLRDTARTTDPLGRVGGEEFAWLLPETALADAAVACERARAAVHGATIVDGVDCSVSSGVVQLGEDETAESLYARADRALYAAKAGGRDRVVAA
jgi:diguanylate cyclase (GGDEF)-like protein/PAS domain S-box-containing protein